MKTSVRSRRGAVSACCLFVVLGVLLIIIAGVVFYFTVWKVPDYSQKTVTVVTRVENRLARDSMVEDRKNGWKYYEKAAKKLDLSKLQPTIPSPSGAPSSYRKNQSISELTKMVKNGVGKGQHEQLREIITQNSEVFQLVNKGFLAPGFFNEPSSYSFNAPSQSKYTKDLELEMKVQALGYFLVIAGQLEASTGNDLAAAKRYMESIHLFENYRGSFSGIMGASQESYGQKAWEKLTELAVNPNLNRKVYSYIKANIDRLRPKTIDCELDYQLYSNEMMMDELAKTLQMKSAKFFLERERKITRGWMLKAMEDYKKDSAGFPDTIKNRKPPQFSVYGALLPVYANNLCRSAYQRLVYFNGLRILLALKAYDRDHGGYPEKLSQLVPKYLAEIPQDPFARDGVFGYKSSGKGAKLYSLGANHQDNGGKDDDLMIMGKFDPSSELTPDKSSRSSGKTPVKQ